MNNVLVTIAPAMDAFTSAYCPARNAVSAMIKFGQVSERGVEQAADRIARLGRHGFGGVTQQRGQRHDGQDGQHKKQRVRFGLELLSGEHHGHEGQQPEQGIVTDFFEQGIHGAPRSNGPFPFRLLDPTNFCYQARGSEAASPKQKPIANLAAAARALRSSNSNPP